MSVRTLDSDLPICFSEVGIVSSGVAVLDDIALTFSAGAPTVLIGPNGSGKTTLLRVAMGLLPVSRGRITWGGRKVSSPTRRAIMFQHPVMLRRSAAANIRYALAAAGVARAERGQRIVELLTLVGLESLAGQRDGCQVASSSASRWLGRWLGRWHETLPFCFWMSRRRVWIQPPPR
jgi:tungstate transport system ATP-binding protein